MHNYLKRRVLSLCSKFRFFRFEYIGCDIEVGRTLCEVKHFCGTFQVLIENLSLVGFLNGIPRDLDVRFEPFVSPLPKAFLCRVHP